MGIRQHLKCGIALIVHLAASCRLHRTHCHSQSIKTCSQMKRTASGCPDLPIHSQQESKSTKIYHREIDFTVVFLVVVFVVVVFVLVVLVVVAIILDVFSIFVVVVFVCVDYVVLVFFVVGFLVVEGSLFHHFYTYVARRHCSTMFANFKSFTKFTDVSSGLCPWRWPCSLSLPNSTTNNPPWPIGLADTKIAYLYFIKSQPFVLMAVRMRSLRAIIHSIHLLAVKKPPLDHTPTGP